MTNPPSSDGPPSFGSNPTGGYGSNPAGGASQPNPSEPKAPQNDAPKADSYGSGNYGGGNYGSSQQSEPQYGQSQPQYGHGQSQYGQSYQQPQVQPAADAELPEGAYGPGSETYWNSSEDDRTMSILVHVLGILTSFIGPAILYFIKRDESPFIRHHAAQSLNFQITMAIGYVVSGVLMSVFIGGLLYPLVAITSIVFEILALVKAKDGQGYKIPISIPIFK